MIIVGTKGITEAVVAETDLALNTHELIKVKINGAEREDRANMIETLCNQSGAELVQCIGNTSILYRKSEEK